MNFTIDISNLIASLVYIVIAVSITLITKRLIPWLKGRLSEYQFGVFTDIVETVVKCVQQTMMTSSNTEKLEEAIKQVQTMLAARGITFDIDIITTQIEATIKTLKLKNGENWYF